MRRLLVFALATFPCASLSAQVPVATVRRGVTVLVSQQGSGAPIKGANITVSPIGTDSAIRMVTSDASGNARVNALPVGQVLINAGAAGFVSISLLFPLTTSGSDTLRLSLNPLGSKGALTEADCQKQLAIWGFAPSDNACALVLKFLARNENKGGSR